MTTNPPEGFRRITPFLAYADVAAGLDWLVRTLGFRERRDRRQTSEDGSIVHAEVDFDGDLVMLGRVRPNFEHQREQNVLLYVYVDDLEAHLRRCRESDPASISEPEDTDYGDRRYWVEDPGGHQWIFAQRVR